MIKLGVFILEIIRPFKTSPFYFFNHFPSKNIPFKNIPFKNGYFIYYNFITQVLGVVIQNFMRGWGGGYV